MIFLVAGLTFHFAWSPCSCEEFVASLADVVYGETYYSAVTWSWTKETIFEKPDHGRGKHKTVSSDRLQPFFQWTDTHLKKSDGVLWLSDT